MKKTLKWSVLLTFVVWIIWMVMPENLSMSPYMDIEIFRNRVSFGIQIPRFWDLIIIIPTMLLIFSLIKDDEDINPGIKIISVVSVLFLLFNFENSTKSIIIYFLIIFSLMVMFMAFQDRPGKRKNLAVAKRLLVSVLGVLLINTLIFGVLNGILIAGVFILIYLIFGMVIYFCIYLFKFIIKVPSSLKIFWAWMNKN